MYQRILRQFACTAIIFALAAAPVLAQPCADNQPVITGAQVVVKDQTLVLYSTPSIPGHTYSWTVTGGVVVSGAGTNQISVNWGNVGTGTISLQETNPAVPCSTTVNKNIAIQPLLIAYFYYTNQSCYGDSISFWDKSVKDSITPLPITNWYWDFGDGGTSTAQNPGHKYLPNAFPLPPYDTTYTIRLVVKNSIGYTDTIFDAVYVNPDQYIPHARFTYTVPNCTYQPVQFDASTSTTPITPPRTKIIHYIWNFGDPASGSNNTSGTALSDSMEVMPTHIFSAPGTYTVSLEIWNAPYCKDTITHQLTILPSVPTAKFIFSSPTCLFNPVNFTDQSTFPAGHAISSWEWNWGDGSGPLTINAPGNPSVTHTFPGLGPYHVQLVVTNDLGCKDTTFKSVSLDPSPLSNFSQNSQCFGDTVKFTDLSIWNGGPPIASYSWNFGDIGSGFFNNSTLQNPTHKFSIAGTFTITMVTVNTSGCPDTLKRDIEIHANPPCDYTYNFGSQANEIDFHIDPASTNINIIGNMVLWNFGDGSYGYGWNPVHIFPAPGIFDVTLTVTDTFGCVGFVTKSILVPSVPVAFFSSNSPVCDSVPVCFIDLSSVPTPPFGFIKTWIWDFGDGSPQDTIHFPNPENVCHLYLTPPDTFTVTLKVIDNNGFSDSYQANVVILQNPKANFQVSTACENMIVNFTDASTANGGGNIISRSWDFGDPQSGTDNNSNLLNPTHIYSHGCGKNYIVRLIVTNFNNCSDTIRKPVWVLCPPPIDFTYDTACLHDLIHFNANYGITQIDSIVTWSWNFGDGTPIGTDPVLTSHLYSGVGTYNVTLTVTDHHGCIHDTTHTIIIHPLPVPGFTWASPTCLGAPVNYTDQSYVPSQFTGYIAKWTWHFDDGSPDTTIYIPNSPNVIHTFWGNTTFTHTVRLTVWTGDSCTGYIDQVVTSMPRPIANFEASPTTCQGQAVQFTDLSQINGGGNLTSWFWTFSDPTSGFGNTSTLQNPQHTFSLGNAWYRVTLLVANGNTCHDTISKLIYIRGLPPVDYAYDTACLHQMVHYNANSGVTMIDSIATWEWDFGDGQPHEFTPVTAQHLYNNTGTFVTTLTVTDLHGCINTRLHTIHVNPLPTTNFSWNSPVCQGKLVCFTDQSFVPQGYLAKWQWHWGDGSNDTTIFIPGAPSVCHRFLGNSTAYLVRLTSWTNDSCSTFIEKTINIVPAPIANFQFSTVTCAGQTVHFTDISQTNGGGALTSWSWDFGDPPSGFSNFSTSQNPIHTYANPGDYLVTLIVGNANGCDSTAKDSVHIQALPIADFHADTACLGQATQFTDLSNANAGLNGSIVSYSWNFGDGSPFNNMTDPTHYFTQAGTFMVTLTITNSNGCIKSITKQVLVNPLPIAAFTYNTPNCVGHQVCYTNMSTTPSGYLGTIVEWHWTWDDGSDTTIYFPGSPSVCHTFLGSATNHLVTLTVTTSDGCVDSIQHLVISIPSPAANFTFSSSSCATQITQFTDQSQPNGGGTILSWLWNFGDPGSGPQNVSNSQNPGHAFTHAGNFWVTLQVTNGSTCADTIGKSVVVDSLPTAAFNADTVCFGHVTTFTNTSSGGTIQTYYWQFGDGQTGNQASPQHQYATAGTFHVILTITTNHGCQNTYSRDVFVIPTPVANFAFSSPTCAGTDSVHFTDLSVAPYGSIVQWVWSFGDSSPSVTVDFPDDPSVYHIYSGGGSYVVTLTVHTGDSCTNTKTNTVVVQSAPLPNFSFAAVRCEHEPVQFTDLSQQNGGAPLANWEWDFGDPNSGTSNNSGVQNPQHTFTTFGTFNVKLTVTNANGCHDTTSKPVTVNEGPHAKFSADTACAGNITTFTDSSFTNVGSITAWLWNFGDPSSGTGNTSTLQNPTHTFTGVGNYLVTLQVTNTATCIADTAKWITVNPKPVAMFQVGSVCVHDSTQFTDLSIAPGSTVVGWFWEFGDGFTSSIQNPYHTYQSAQTWNVTETVTNLQGCKDSITIPVIARPTPNAAFTYTNFFCPAGQVNFQDQSTGVGAAIVSHFWTFEPGQNSTQVNPTHVFTITDTTYAVMEIVTDNFGCQDTVIDSVFVKPGISFKFNSDTVCYKNVTHFTPVDQALGDSLYSVFWDFGDPPSNQLNYSYNYHATHTFTHPGTFIVKMKAWDTDNCVDSVYQSVIVYALPQPVFHYNRVPCDSNLYFHDSTTIAGSGSIASWTWIWGDGTPNTVINAPGPGDATHLYVNPGFYKVILKITNTHGCFDTSSMEVQRIPCIQAVFLHPDTLLCARYPVAFTDSSLPVAMITRWHWKWGDGTADTIYFTHDPVLHHTFSNGGTFTVRLIVNAVVSGTSIADSSTQSIVIHPTPITLFSNTPVCLNQITLFADTSKTFGARTDKWSWNFGESYSAPNDTSTFKNPTHKYDSSGYFDVKLHIMNQYGCEDSLTKTTRVFAIPTAKLSNTVACSGNPTYFYDKSVLGDTLIGYWFWRFGDMTSKTDSSLSQNPHHIYDTTGIYQVNFQIRDKNGCTSFKDTTVTVNVTPVSSFTFTDNTNGMPGKLLMDNLSSGATTYVWDFGNGQTSTDMNPVVTYSQDGTYIIKLISSNEFTCSDTTYYKYEVLFRGLFIPNAFSPSNSNIAVRYFKPVGINIKEYHIEVFDNWGHLVWESIKLDAQGKPEEGWDGTFNGELMPMGVYMWKCSAIFIDDTIWQGASIGQGEAKTFGTVTLIR
jgi:PKD repeat protein